MFSPPDEVLVPQMMEMIAGKLMYNRRGLNGGGKREHMMEVRWWGRCVFSLGWIENGMREQKAT
jgi:hypothetical protein